MRGKESYKWEKRKSFVGRKDISLRKDFFKGKLQHVCIVISVGQLKEKFMILVSGVENIGAKFLSVQMGICPNMAFKRR